jgi:hypothetical protein
MKLSQLSKEPQLIEISIDDEEIVKEYGEPLVFYTWDRQPMDVFTRLANQGEKADIGELLEIVRTLVLDEDGKEILTDKSTLPTPILMQVINKVIAQLGK